MDRNEIKNAIENYQAWIKDKESLVDFCGAGTTLGMAYNSQISDYRTKIEKLKKQLENHGNNI